MGLKPRSVRPIEMSMSAGGGGFSSTATVNLLTGKCQARVSSKDWNVKNSEWVTKDLACVIAERGLAILRASASAILRDGNTRYREQFAQQGVSFTARSRTQTATADFAIDVGAGTRYDQAWDQVFGVVHAALRSDS